ncbi:adenylate/guanylate cyclase domain-containing protein [soil metagenome]
MSDSVAERPQGEQPVASAAAQRALLAHLRHELRTPINAIIGYSEMLTEDAAEAGHERLASDLGKIRSAGGRLLDIVNRLLDPAHIESHAGELDLAEVEARLRHDVRVPSSTVIGYAELLQEEAAELGQEHLIEDLQKIHAAGKRLIEQIGTIVRLSGSPGESAPTLAAEIPHLVRDALSAIRPLESAHAAPARGEQGAVLVVDDSPTNRDLLSRRLARDGYAVTVAENGREALERISERAFDLVLLDLMMPELNGFEVLRHMKGDERLRHIPVIMISALDEIDSVVRCIEMGAEDYLPKPFNPTLLQARISSSMERKRLRDREQAYLEQLAVERERSERLLLNVLPQPIAERLKRGETEIADSFAEATVLFSDLVGFTEIAARLAPTELVRRLNVIFSAFDELAERHKLEKIKTIGDAYLIVGGLPALRADHAEAVAEMALDMLAVTHRLAEESGDSFQIRVGIHTGPVVAGVVGTTKFTYDLWGDTVNTASRMESYGIPGTIQVSEATYVRLRERFHFQERGPIEVKGKGRLRTYLLTGRQDAPSSTAG